MKPKIYIKICLILIIFSFFSNAQNQIKSRVIASGGGIMESSSYKITGTIGQPAIGISGNQSNKLISGFWYEVLNPTDAKEEDNLLPAEFRLEQNYPNPFNPTTSINYSLKEESVVRIKLFNSIGQEVAVLVSESKPAGKYSLLFNANRLASGVYFYRIEASSISVPGENFINTKKLILMK